MANCDLTCRMDEADPIGDEADCRTAGGIPPPATDPPPPVC